MSQIIMPTAPKLVAMALGLRLMSSVVGFLAAVTFPAYTDQHFSVFARPNAFWDTFARYDAGWYYGIAAHGYQYVDGGRSNLAFFPVYPMLMRAGGWLFGGQQPAYYLSGIAVSWLAFSAAMVLLYQLARVDLDHRSALRATAYAAMFPSAYFFGRVYSEAVFFLMLLATVLALRKQRWLLACLAGAVMTATRVNGVAFLPALALIAWQSSAPNPRDRRAAIAAVGGMTLGILAYSAYNYELAGDPLAWYYSIQRWGYHPFGNPLSGLVAIWRQLLTRPYEFLAVEPMAPYDAFNATLATMMLVAVPFVWKRFGAAYAMLIVLGLAIPLSSGQYEGLGRYCSVLFPLPLLLASFKGETRHLVLLASSAMLYALALALFVNVHPLF